MRACHRASEIICISRNDGSGDCATFVRARAHLGSIACPPFRSFTDAMGAANRREAARTRGVSSISTVVSSLPNLGAGVRNYVHHVRFVPKQDSRTSPRARAWDPSRHPKRASPRRVAVSPIARAFASSRGSSRPRIDPPRCRPPVNSSSGPTVRVLVRAFSGSRTRDVSSLAKCVFVCACAVEPRVV